MSADAQRSDTHRATVLAVTWLAGMAGHDVGDYLVQRDWDARHKQHRTPTGRRALVRHAATYAATQAAAKWLTCRAVGARVPWRALWAGQVVEGLLHAVIDDGRPLAWLADLIDKRALHDLVAPGLNGRMLMDQACHRGVQIPVGAVVTAMLTGGAQ